MTTFWPRRCDNHSPSIRAARSTPPPAENPTMSWIGRVGYRGPGRGFHAPTKMPARAEGQPQNSDVSWPNFLPGPDFVSRLEDQNGSLPRSGAGSCSHSSSVPSAMSVSHSEYLRVPRLDLVSALFDARRIVLERFDFLERFAAGLLLDQRVHGMGARKVDQQLLGSTGVQPVLEKARRVGSAPP